MTTRPRITKTVTETGLTIAGDVGALLDFHRPDELDRAPTGGTPYVSFYNQKQGKAQDVVEALGATGPVTVGMPYVVSGGAFFRADSLSWIVLGEPMPYWCTTDSKNDRVATWVTKQQTFDGRSRIKVGGRPVQDAMLAMVLLLPNGEGTGLHPDLAPATVTICDFQKGTQSGSIRSHMDKIEDTTDVKKASTFGELVASLPPMLRLTSTFDPKPRTGGEFPYAIIRAKTRPITTVQYEAFLKWANDADSQEELARVRGIFEERCNAVRDSAND